MKWGYYRKVMTIITSSDTFATAVNHSPMAAMSQHNISEDLEPADANNAIHLNNLVMGETLRSSVC
jgi:hypothetical protein